ncbi:MAG: TadE family protein [Acidimicrobiales bacterium]
MEFSLVILPLIFVLYGLIAFGMMFALKQSMTNAAAEGARSALGAPAGTEVAVAKAAVAQRMGWLGAKYSAADSPDPVVAPCVNDATKNCITVRVNYPYGTKPLIPLAPGLGLFTPSTFGTEATVRLS